MCGSDKGTVPITRDPEEIYRDQCGNNNTGLREPAAPVFEAVVVNAGDLIWRDNDYTPIQENTGSVYLIDNAN